MLNILIPGFKYHLTKGLVHRASPPKRKKSVHREKYVWHCQVWAQNMKTKNTKWLFYLYYDAERKRETHKFISAAAPTWTSERLLFTVYLYTHLFADIRFENNDSNRYGIILYVSNQKAFPLARLLMFARIVFNTLSTNSSIKTLHILVQ